MLKVTLIILFLTLFIIIGNKSYAEDEYFLTLRYDEVNLRQGPSKEYPIKIFYKKKYLPVLVFDSSDNYRKIRDHEHNNGWIHVSQLSRRKAALIYDDQTLVFKKSTIFSKPLVVLEKGRLCLILKCNDDWCKVKTEKYVGWVKKKSLWGNF